MTTARPRLRRRRAGGVLAATALALGLTLGVVPGLAGAPAGAHDGDAVIEVEVHPAGLQIHYIAHVTWADDGHPADGATVTATAIGADGTQLTPVTLAQADSDGRYAGVLEYPSAGSWTVRITSIDPNGTLEQAQEVTPPPTTTAPANEVTTSPDEATGDDATSESEDFAPADDGTGDSDEAADADDAAAEPGDDSDDGGMPLLLVLAAAALVIGGAVAAVTVMRRKRAGSADTAGGPTEPDGTATGDPDRTAADATVAAGDGPAEPGASSDVTSTPTS
jgi:hypothetical protein